jgi:hypothetical protein
MHPFYVRGKGWTPAKALRPGDLLPSHDGQWVPVEEVEATGEAETVYNLRIADFHTYFVGSLAWGFSIWTHNSRYEKLMEAIAEVSKKAGLNWTIEYVKRVFAKVSKQLKPVIDGRKSAKQTKALSKMREKLAHEGTNQAKSPKQKGPGKVRPPLKREHTEEAIGNVKGLTVPPRIPPADARLEALEKQFPLPVKVVGKKQYELPERDNGSGRDQVSSKKEGQKPKEEHIDAAVAETQMAYDVHQGKYKGFENDVVLFWGHPVTENGVDLISVDAKTGRVTFWDSKHSRVETKKIETPSDTFRNPDSMNEAVDQARELIQNSNLPGPIKQQALDNLEAGKYQYTTVTAPALTANCTLNPKELVLTKKEVDDQFGPLPKKKTT